MRRTAPYLFVVAILGLSACGTHHSRPPADDDGGTEGDVGGDVDRDGASVDEPDGRPLECGDSRGALDLPPEPIINGTDTFDPEVVSLSEGQVLAVGAMAQGWGRHSFGFCTGTLISPELVLTAAHCLDDFEEAPDEVDFVVGEDWSIPRETFQVAEVYVHPAWRPASMSAEFDVGIVRLIEPATDILPEIEPFPVNCEELSRRDFLGQLIQAVGYGATDGDGGADPWDYNTLRYWTVLDVVSLLDEYFTVDGFGDNGVCNGDSGGPALWTMPDGVVRVVGVVSVGQEGCVDRSDYATSSSVCDFIESVAGGCEGATATGECDDEVAVYCEDGEVQRVLCSDDGLTCGDVGGGWMRCIEPVDPCDGESFEGRCEGDVAVWCEDEAIRRASCPDIGSWCEVTAAGYARCVEDSCGGLSWEGRCDGDDALWCEDGEILRRRCDDCRQRCGWSEEHQAYYCL